ncbi:hypothetical protein, partial [Mesorhizobium sp. M7A.F.Ca.MR.362.00.0.0]|uniref:hypothetical protein n=1 Tax=Mesorhizobium sp. M7A.F.Ca.MR.362.00.0.0 TaxID=2496779 RepID=UPI0019D46F2A
MRDIFALETSLSGPHYQRVIWFKLQQPGDNGFYRAVSSLNAFFHARRLSRNVTTARQFTRHDERERQLYQ